MKTIIKPSVGADAIEYPIATFAKARATGFTITNRRIDGNESTVHSRCDCRPLLRLILVIT
jgi:hypothetical protein